MDNKKISHDDFWTAYRVQKISSLCWELAGELSESYVGYENELRMIHGLAIEFDKQFEDLVGFLYEG